MNHNEWKNKYGRMRAISDRVCEMRRERAKRLCRAAGLDDGLLGIHPHNAMVAFHAGQPWQGIDYSKVRACIRMLDLQFEPYRILDKWDKRVRSIGE